MTLHNKIAIITGGAQGIGLGCALRLAAEGATIVIADINTEKAEAAVASLKDNGHTPLFVHTDVANPAAVDNLFDQTMATYGRVDILVNNAALVHYPPANVNFLELADETWQKNIDISLNGTFYCSSRAARIMVKQVVDGTAEEGCIINISSGGASRAHRHLASYDASKGGMEALTRAMALDLAPWHIRVNTIVPGNITVNNSMGGAIGPDAAKGTIPLGRPGTPADIGAAAAYLASADARYVTAAKLYVDGGMDSQLRSPAVDRQIKEDVLTRVYAKDDD